MLTYALWLISSDTEVYSIIIKAIWWICWHAGVILKLWSCGLVKKENDGVWSTRLMYGILPNRARWVFSIVDNIRKMLLMNLVAILTEIETCFPDMYSNRNYFGFWNLILFKLFNQSSSRRMVKKEFDSILESRVLDHIFHNEIYTLDPH